VPKEEEEEEEEEEVNSCLTTHLLISYFLDHSLIQFLCQPRLW
jgi:hypothetical protein